MRSFSGPSVQWLVNLLSPSASGRNFIFVIYIQLNMRYHVLNVKNLVSKAYGVALAVEYCSELGNLVMI